jgi:hypothetical protein
MPWVKSSEAEQILAGREARKRGEEADQQYRERRDNPPQQPSLEEFNDQEPVEQPVEHKPVPASSPGTVLPPPKFRSEARIERETDGGRFLPRPAEPQYYDDLDEARARLMKLVTGQITVKTDPIPSQQAKGICSGCRIGKPDHNGSCTGMCAIWWPENI